MEDFNNNQQFDDSIEPTEETKEDIDYYNYDKTAIEMNDTPTEFIPINNDIYDSQEQKSDFEYQPPKPEKIKNKGLRIFTVILAFVLVAGVSASAGYIFSELKNNTNKTTSSSVNSAPKIELEKRPNTSLSSYTEVANKVDKSVVSIMVYSTDTSSYGSASGVVYSKDGYIITNDHIYDELPNAKFLIRFSNGKEVKASYIAGDVRSDLAVLKLDEKVKDLVPANFGDSDEIVLGEEVVALGYTSDYGDSATLTKGIISATKRRVQSQSTNYASTFIQTDATINPGNSGGALCNMHGQVIGITSSKLAGDVYEAVSYAIPTTTMKKVVTSLIKDGSVTYRAKLGITYKEITTVVAESNKLPKGIYIGTISSDSGLYNKGFSEGDVITHINGQEIITSDVLLNILDNSSAGDTVELTIYKVSSKVSENVKVKLSQDKGSSSYTTKSNNDSNYDFNFDFDNDSSDDNSNSENPKTFDFPLD